MNYDNIINLAIEVIAVILAGFVLPKLRAYLKAKLDAEQWEALKRLVTVLVEAAEQTLKEDDPTGKLRKQYVVSQLHELSYDVTEEVNALIEAAVYGLNEAKHGNV